ncbi:unnamed protein product [Strongylus vulgaris]|uniref:Uncharacterized protein n=1 Tax=Strongylus vulgaris TaxID=40348 RepID=A0A3P7I152_STRVU|nr:unnamed protein product [Strongylus vulgaris]
MSFKRPHHGPYKISSPTREPEVITLADSDEEDSQDLFDSLSEGKTQSIEILDSDDLFSSPESQSGSPHKRKAVPCSPFRKQSITLSPFLKRQGLSSSSRLEERKSCRTMRRSSSACISPWKSAAPTVSFRRSAKSISDDMITKEDPLIITLEEDNHSKNVKFLRSPGKRRKCDLWAKNRLEEMGRKFEERNQILSKLVKEDGDFFDIVHGGAFERVRKKAKEELKEGNVIRKQTDRAKLLGVAHPTSEAYFDALELSPQSKQQRVNEVPFIFNRHESNLTMQSSFCSRVEVTLHYRLSRSLKVLIMHIPPSRE